LAAIAFAIAAVPRLSSAQTQQGSTTATLRIHEVTIEGNDYAFRAPETVRPGVTAFQFVNAGKVMHEVQIFRFKPGISVQTAQHYLATDSAPDSAYASSGSVLIADPNSTARERVLVTLTKGDLYILRCQFTDGPKKPKHSAMGMFALLRVE